MSKIVTDPALLAQLNGSLDEPAPSRRVVTDPALLAQLNAPTAAEPTQADIDAASPANGMPWYEKAAVGAGAAVDRTYRGVRGMLPPGLLPKGLTDAPDDDAALYQKYHPGGFATAGEVGADIAMGAVPVAKGASVLNRALQAARVGRAAPLAADVLANTGYAAATAPEDRGSAAAFGGAGAAVGRGVGRLATGIVRPTPEAAALIEQGVRLTPGQAAGTGSFLNRAEQLLASNPVASHPIVAARARALEDANQRAAEAVAKRVGFSMQIGRHPADTIAQLRDQISRVYDEVLPRLSMQNADLTSLANQIYTHVPESHNLVGEWGVEKLQGYFFRRLSNLDQNPEGVTSGELLKQVDTELGNYASKLARSTTAEEKVAAPMWWDAQHQWREYVMKAAAPESKDYWELSKANAGYRELLALEKALASSGGERIHPGRLTKALQAANIQTGDLADLSRNMNATMPGTIPDSGTTQRMLVNALPLALAGGSFATGIAPVVGAGAAAAALLGTQTGARAMTGLSGPQKAMVNALRSGGRMSQAQAEEAIKSGAAQAGRLATTQR